MLALKKFLLLTTALTAAVFVPVSVTAATTVINKKQTVDSNGVIQGEYRLDGGTWTETGGEIHGIDGVTGIPGSATFPNGFYQESSGGLSIQGSDTRIDFNGGVIWDSSAYIPFFPKEAYGTLYSGVSVNSNELSGNLLVNNGTFTGAIDIRKGTDQEALKGTDKDGKTVEYDVRSKGDLIISGGSFFLSKNSQFIMYKTNEGTLSMRGGNWFVGYDIGTDGKTATPVLTPVVVTVDAADNELLLRGGKYDIAEGSMLKLAGLSGKMEADSASYEFSGKGTLSVGFLDGFTINTNVKWDDGRLNQRFGSLTIQEEVTVNAFTQDDNKGSLNILAGGVLSVASDVSMNGNMSGKGTLKLTGTANGTIGGLTKFGTIIVGEGSLTFTRGNDTQIPALDYLIGATGDGKIGTINVEGQTYAGTVTLNNSVIRLTAELITDSLDMGRGDIVFVKGANGVTNGRLTLKGKTTIWNTSRIITEPTSEYADVTTGVLTAKDGTVLTFADAEGSDENTHFESGALTVSVENGASMVSNARQVSFGTLKMTKGATTVESGILNVNNVVLGDGTANTGTLIINADGIANIKNELIADLGAKVEIDGVLNVGTLETKGQKDGVATIMGAGTLNITKSANLKGLINGLAHLNVTGISGATASATFGGEYSDRIGEMKVIYGEVLLKKEGTLTIDSLQLDHGTILLENEKSILALRQSPGEDGGFSGEGNSISGKGTLELLGSTNIKFSGGTAGNVGYLGGLKIGQGTATITGDTTLGSVSFSAVGGGTLRIDKNATLTLSDESGVCTREDKCRITINAGNVVNGEGTLRLVNGDGSTFSGTVDLGRLKLDSGVSRTIRFNSATESKIGILDTGVDSNIVVDSALTIDRIDGNATVFGNGTLTVNGQADGNFITTGTEELTNLKVGGNLVVKDAKIGNVIFINDSDLTVNGTTTVANITTGSNNVISGEKLALTGTGAFAANSVKTNVLSLSSGAKAMFTGNNEVNRLDLAANSAVSINSGAMLTLDDIGADGSSLFTGSGTLALNKSGMTVNSKLSDLGTLAVNKSATLSGTAQVGSITAANGATLTVDAAAQANTVSIASGAGLVQNADMTVGTLSFGANSGSTLTVNKTLNITQGINAGANRVNGSGTINLSGGANGSFATGDSFENGHLIIGSGTAGFTGNTTMASVDFSGDDGRLNIESGNTLTLAKIATKASNTVTGAGTLSLSGTGSTFNAPIASLDEINIAGGSASFNKNATVRKLSFDGGSATVGSGAVLSISDLAQNKSGTLGTVSGGGVLKINRGELSTGGNRIGAVYVGSGTVNIADTSATGALVFEDENGTLSVGQDKTLTVSDKLNVTGNLTGDGTLMLANGGTFSKALTFGAIETGAGALTFYEDTTARKVAVGNGSAYFRKGTNISDLSIDAGSVFFNGANTKIGALSMTGAGKATFNQNASITNGATIGGTLDIGVTHLSVSNGLTFSDNSSLHLRLTKAATDDTGTIVDHNAYGKINVESGTIVVGNNVNLDLTIDYGLHTATDGTEFQLVSGAVGSGRFTFANSRYKLEEVTCSSVSGFCYKLKETSNAEEIVTEEKGSQNNQNTAAAVLDGGLFNESDKMFPVASHLDALSQKKGGGRAYLNALTALAPDVSGAVTGQSVLTQTRVSKSVFNRLSGLQQKMGNRSEKYRQMRELYGRSGGSAYSSGLMRSADYYKRAGYDAEPAGRAYPTYDIRRTPRNYNLYNDEDIRPKRKVAKYRSQRQADYGAFYGARPAVGVWAQGLYNTNEYKSASKEDGFSADSTGVSMGLDVIFADVAAIGFGYARTTSDLSALQRSTDVSGDTFFLYGMYKPADWYLSGVVSSGKNTFEEQKNLSGLMVSDNYDTKTVGGQLMLGFDRKGWNPAFGLRYSSVSRAAHEDSVGQKIASFSNTVFSAVAETQKTFELSRAGKGVWSSDLSAGLVYDFSRSEDEATVSLTNGASYTVKGSDMDPYGAELGAAISYVWGKSVDLSARYNLDIRPEWFSHTLTATLRVTF